MRIEFNSLREVLLGIMVVGSFLSAAAALHWKLFVAPLLKKILLPYGEKLEVTARVARRAHPEIYKQEESAVLADRAIRRAI
jgi:hypothetical protein